MPFTGWQPYYTVWSLLCLGWFATAVIRAALAPLLPLIRTEFGLSYGQAGDLATAYFLTYAALQFLSGNLGDRWGRKRVLVLGGILNVLATLGTAAARSPGALFAARFFVGLAHGTYFGNDRSLIAPHTPPARMGLGQGLSFAGMGMGIWFGTAAAGFLAAALDWRGVFALLAVLPAAATALIALWVVDPSRRERGQVRPMAWRPALTNSDLWLLYLAGMMPTFAQWLIGSWGPAILMEGGAADLSTAAFCAGLFGIMALPGLLFFGALSDALVRRGKGRKFVAVGAYLALAADMGALAWGIQRGASLWVLVPLVAMVGALTWGPWAAIFSLCSHIMPARIYGTVFGTLNGWAMLGAVVAPAVTGRLRDAGGSFASSCFLAAALAAVGALLVAGVRPAFRAGPEVAWNERARASGSAP